MGTSTQNSLCLLCYKSAPNLRSSYKNEHHNRSDNNESFPSNQFLLLLLRHLKISPQSQDISHSVLCKDCTKLGNEFSNLFLQLERIQLELGWKVEGIHERMSFAGRVPSRFFAFRQQFEGKRNGQPEENARLQKECSEIQRLRKKIMMNCELQRKSTQPRVSLSRFSLENINERKRKTQQRDVDDVKIEVDVDVYDNAEPSEGYFIEAHEGSYLEKVIKVEEVQLPLDSVPLQLERTTLMVNASSQTSDANNSLDLGEQSKMATETKNTLQPPPRVSNDKKRKRKEWYEKKHPGFKRNELADYACSLCKKTILDMHVDKWFYMLRANRKCPPSHAFCVHCLPKCRRTAAGKTMSYCPHVDCKIRFLQEDTQLDLVPKEIWMEAQRLRNEKVGTELSLEDERVAKAKEKIKWQRGKVKTCRECLKEFPTRYLKEKHLQTEHRVGVIKCEYCGKEYTSRVALINHRKGKGGCTTLFRKLRYICPKCRLQFKSKNFRRDLERHAKNCTG
ncbi:unnamed protein product [Orchesella dallaii]|uniref:C2H2-type domain-containing protein n=1 Tax=Orchesella dallaii TaxID=48710 RepID=A0ABP1QZE3_9HEXA